MMEELKIYYIKYKFIIWPVLSGVSSVAIIALVIVPQLLGYLNLRSEIYSTQSRSNSLLVKAQELQQINEADTQQKLKTVLSVLPADPEVIQAMNTLQGLIANQSASGHPLILKDASYIAPGPGSKEFKIKITISGQLDSIRSFLIGLQKSPRLVQVQNIKAHFQSDGSGIETDIPLSIFFEPTSSTPFSVDQEVPKLSADEEKKLAELSANVSAPLASAQFPASPLATGSGNLSSGFQGQLPGVAPQVNLNVDVSSVQLGKADPFQ